MIKKSDCGNVNIFMHLKFLIKSIFTVLPLFQGNYIGSWRCFAEITGDSCSTLVEQNFNLNELMHRNENGIQNNQNQQQHQLQHNSGQQHNPASMLHCTPIGDQPNIRYTQNGALSKNKGAVWH
jgi:hypothetical protein